MMNELGPAKVLARTMANACLHDFPWLDLSVRPEDDAALSQWAAGVGDELRRIQRKEETQLEPQGPAGMWGHFRNEFTRRWRPHKLEELSVEAMYPHKECPIEDEILYIIVLQSKELGLFVVYLNETYQYCTTGNSTAWQVDLSARSIITGPEAAHVYDVLTAEVSSSQNA